MKVLILCIVYITLLAALHGSEAMTCRSASHCRYDECCMTRSSLVGACREKGCKGCECELSNSKSHLGDMYLQSCPCAEGLACIAEKIIENPEDGTVVYINPTCQEPKSLNVGHTLLTDRVALLPLLKKFIK